MSKFEIVMPKMGESIIEATITKWLKSVGETLEEDESIVEIATDKVDSEIPSPVDGVLSEILFQEGDVVPVGTVIALVKTDDDDDGDSQEEKSATQNVEKLSVAEATKESVKTEVETTTNDFSNSTRFYSPLVKSIAKKESISVAELDKIKGSGKDGRVTKQDILNYLENRNGTQQTTAKPALATPKMP